MSHVYEAEVRDIYQGYATTKRIMKSMSKELISHSSIWQKLKNHSESIRRFRILDLFKEDPERFDRFSFCINDILVDFSKNHFTSNTLELLFKLAEECELESHIKELFEGGKVNSTEGRAALHTALRDFDDDQKLIIAGVDVRQEIKNERAKMRAFVDKVKSGEWQGYSGQKITDIVHIGIGGSRLGVECVIRACEQPNNKLQVHFVSSVDSKQTEQVLAKLNPETTLFIIVSKSFKTLETITNANIFLEWMSKHCSRSDALSKHFIGISANTKEMKAFGIYEENMFVFWEWVGGRYSVWSAVGLTIAIYLGMDKFEEFLKGAFIVDEHFKTEPLYKNIPVIMGLLNIWDINFLSIDSNVILPYDYALSKLPAYIQQLDMESCGKSVTLEGDAVDYQTGSVVWGAGGIDGQHAFFQLLHQGTQKISADFIVPIDSSSNSKSEPSLANALAQSQALMIGKDMDALQMELGESPDYRVHPGDRPSTTFLLPEITPSTLGSLFALYEHKIFVQSVIWNINPFDQWGVEHGKELAKQLMSVLSEKTSLEECELDGSTEGLISYIH